MPSAAPAQGCKFGHPVGQFQEQSVWQAQDNLVGLKAPQLPGSTAEERNIGFPFIVNLGHRFPTDSHLPLEFSPDPSQEDGHDHDLF